MPNPLKNVTPEALENFINSGGLSDLVADVVSSETTDIDNSKQPNQSEVSSTSNPSLAVTKEEKSTTNVLVEEEKQESSDSTPKVYPADVIDKTPAPSTGFKTLDFTSPAELISFFDDSIINKQVKLHNWQIEISDELACAGKIRPNALHPLKYCLVAANGSGKDAFVVTPFVIWFLVTKIRSRVIITSSSGTQLTAQTENYIKTLAEKVNAYFGVEIFKIRQRYIKCLMSGSECRMFATDEAGKAEGYHPLDPNAEMAIIVNEGKSVTEEIHSALRRCTGYNYWLEVSTPGQPQGFFYRAHTTWRNTRRVTSYDCPHLSEEEREQDKLDLGETSALFRSKHLALFTSLETDTIITKEVVDRLLANPPSLRYINWPKRVGIDLAAGGDENALCITQGATCLKERWFIEKDTIVTAQRINDWLLDNGIEKSHPYIYADDGGVGKAIIDNLVDRGWNIKRVLNQSAAIKRKQFGNRGAEMWYFVKRVLEESLFDITTLSQKTQEQLFTRQYNQQNNGGRIFLESKKEAKAHGRHSPDRADAFVLSFAGLTIDNFLEGKLDTSGESDANKKPDRTFKTQEELYRFYEDQVTFKNLEATGKYPVQSKVKGSLKELFSSHGDNDMEYQQRN